MSLFGIMARADAPRRGPVTRDLTNAYLRHRKKKAGQNQQRGHSPFKSSGYGKVPGSEHLIGADSANNSAANSPCLGERASLPPQWVDFADKADEEIKEIRVQLGQLAKAQQRRLLKSRDASDVPDREVEVISNSIGTLIRCCEQSIHQVRTAGAGDGTFARDDEFRQNMQRRLAAQLQQLSKECRETQKAYMGEVQRCGAADAADLEAAHNLDMADNGRNGFSQSSSGRQQMQEFEDMEQIAAQRSSEIAQVAASINELHTIFKELAALVIDQGTILDRIDYNTEKIYSKTENAKGQMEKAVKRKKKNDSRTTKCLLFWVAADVIAFLILLIKYNREYGLQNVLPVVCVIAAIITACGVAVCKFQARLCPSQEVLSQMLPEEYHPSKLWKRIRPGPVNAAKAASAAHGMGVSPAVFRQPGL